MATPTEPRSVSLSIGEGGILYRKGQAYSIPSGDSVKFSFVEGTLMKSTTPAPLNLGFVLIKDTNYPPGTKIVHAKPEIILKANRKLRIVEMNADTVLNVDTEFTIGNDTKIIVPTGTMFVHKDIIFTKMDNRPMYLGRDPDVKDLFNAFLGNVMQ